MLNGLIRSYKERKVEQYVNQFAVRVQNINQTIASISSSVMLTNSIQVQNAIRLTNQNLQLVRSNIQLNMSVKLTDLKDMVDDFEDNLEGLNGNGAGTKLNEMNKIIANMLVSAKSKNPTGAMIFAQDLYKAKGDVEVSSEQLAEIRKVLSESSLTALVEAQIKTILDGVK